MRKIMLNIMATTGITLVVLAMVAVCYGGTLICISTVFQALLLNIVIYVGIYILDYFEYRYSILDTGIKLIYVIAAALFSGLLFDWYANLPLVMLIVMTVVIFGVCLCLDMLSIRDEVKTINRLLTEKNNN